MNWGFNPQPPDNSNPDIIYCNIDESKKRILIYTETSETHKSHYR